ncbi:MAG: hypothetical protein HQL88_10445 [Magnetococcales bacterium]|nr:hypothetical protein [Magnetococcales bacterium]
MKIYLFWFVKRLALLGLLIQPVVAFSQDAASLPAGRGLLAQQIRIERPDLKMNGEIVLRSLQPLAGELRLQQARGEPRQIFAAVMRLVPGAKGALDGLFEQVEIHDLDLQDLVITLAPEGYTLQLASATIPEGVLEQVTGRLNGQKEWQLSSGALRLKHIPLASNKGGKPRSLSYRKLEMTGTGQESFSATVSKPRVGHLAGLADPTGFFGDVLRAMGFAQGMGSAPLSLDRLSVAAVIDAQRMVSRTLQLQAPHASASGQATMAWQPHPRQLHLNMAVTTADQSVKHFQTVLPVSAAPSS